MGLIMVKMKLTNVFDLERVQAGQLSLEAVRAVEVEALADTGAISAAIPEEIAQRLGVPTFRTGTVRVADGRSLSVRWVGGILFEVLGRTALGEAVVLPPGTQPLLGAVQLEVMDLVLVPGTGAVITNPAHPDGPVVPMLRAG
jgi:predicted aspartyl protease